jgi:hypothetical protein
MLLRLKKLMHQSMRLGPARSVTRSMAEFNEIYRSPIDRHVYSFSGYAGVENCSDCDSFTQVNEYDRIHDGAVLFFCNRCENKHHL